MARKSRPTFGDKFIAFFTGESPAQVARRRGHIVESSPRRMPTERTYERIPSERLRDFQSRTHTMRDLEWVIMTPGEPLEVRRAAAEEWARVSPKPLRPHLPGIGHDAFWQAFRDAYREQELW